LLVLVIGCGGDGSSSTIDGPPTIDASPDGTTGCVPARTIFLNRAGGTYSPGVDDATANKTPILGATRMLPAATVDPADWANGTACIRAKLAGYKLDIR